MTLTPEDLAEIEAPVIHSISTVTRQDALALIAALKEAWAENAQLKKDVARIHEFWMNDLD